MLSRSDELRFYEAEKRILRQFEDDKDVQDYLEYLEEQDEELFIRVSDLKIEIQELEEELNVVIKELEEVEEELCMTTDHYNTELQLNVHLLNENSVLKADLERLRRED